MKRNQYDHAAITERCRNLTCSEDKKQVLNNYLMSILAEGKSFLLKQNRVMIMEQDNKNKFLILEKIETSEDSKVFYLCTKCSDIKFSSFLTGKVPADKFKTCIHSEICNLLWGEMVHLEDERAADKTSDIVEVLADKPRYLAVVHPSNVHKKGAGIVTLTTKTLKPKCLVCKGQDKCIHLTIHFQQYKRSLEDLNDDNKDENRKKLRVEKIEIKNTQKDDPRVLDPYRHHGPESNVFDIKINFLQTKETSGVSMNKELLFPKYEPGEKCFDHGNEYEEQESILNMESSKVIIHHTKHVDASKKKVLFRPTIKNSENEGCSCKKWYTGQEDQLLRVSSADERIRGGTRTLHFVSYEFYFDYLSRLLIGGETLNSQIKAQRFLEENFFGCEKKPEYKKVLQQGFEIFLHALEFPEDANYCYECPQELEGEEKEDNFKDDIEYSIIDGIQMGCQTNSLKADIDSEYFKEALVKDVVVNGIECKDRTFCSSIHVRKILGTLLDKADDSRALSKAVKDLGSLELDSNANSVLNLLNRLLFRNKIIPEGYRPFLRELHLETPVSALLTPYSSAKELYESFMSYLNNKIDIFSTPSSLEVFINQFPVLIDCIKEILETESSAAFLPHDVSFILKNMIKLRFDFDKKSRKVAVARRPPNEEFEAPIADFFPAYPIHTMENVYKADARPETNTAEDDCEKNFSSASSISGGLGTVTCNHKITKGFRAIQKGESPALFCHSLFRRLPRKVKAHKRVVIYDFACKLHKVCLRRYPYRIRRFQFVIDRHHQPNHKACSEAYNISKYPEMAHVNTQVAEQLNNSLRKLSTVVAYSNFKTYLRIIQVFITVKNLKIKGVI